MKTEKNEEQLMIEKKVRPLVEEARTVVIESVASRREGVAFLETLKTLRERIEEQFHPTRNKTASYAAYQAALQTEKAFYEPLKTAEYMVKEKIRQYDRNEALRLQTERAAEEAKRQQAQKAEEERLRKMAIKADKQGDGAMASALIERANHVVEDRSMAVVEPGPKLYWKCRVVDVQLACASVADGVIPASVVEFRQSGLNELAKGYDGKTQICGLEFYQDVRRI